MTPIHQRPELAAPEGVTGQMSWGRSLTDRLERAFERAEGWTWMVIIAVYGGIATMLAAASWMPLWVVCPTLVVLGAWHAHMQHELLHGHPTSREWLNDLMASLPVTLLYPYSVYKRSHMDHHLSDLANPMDDPESFYVSPDAWARFGAIRRGVLLANNTLLGRFLIGPFFAAMSLYREQGAHLIRGDRRAWLDWTVHAVLVSVYLWTVSQVSGLSPWLYVVGVAYPALGLAMVRSFLEHRAVADHDQRTAVVEANWFWSLLFLNNNLHVMHHDRPGEPWYRLPRLYREQRDAVLQRNGNYVYAGYGDVTRRFLLTPKDVPVFQEKA